MALSHAVQSARGQAQSKTAIVEGLARRIISGDVPESLKNKELVAMDLGAMIADRPARAQVVVSGQLAVEGRDLVGFNDADGE